MSNLPEITISVKRVQSISFDNAFLDTRPAEEEEDKLPEALAISKAITMARDCGINEFKAHITKQMSPAQNQTLDHRDLEELEDLSMPIIGFPDRESMYHNQRPVSAFAERSRTKYSAGKSHVHGHPISIPSTHQGLHFEHRQHTRPRRERTDFHANYGQGQDVESYCQVRKHKKSGESASIRVRAEVRDAVTKLCLDSWKYPINPGGKDAKSLEGVIGMNINTIYKINHSQDLLMRYDAKKQTMLLKGQGTREKHVLPFDQLPGQSRLKTSSYQIPGDDLDESVNECFLFHGTIVDNVAAICQEGFQLKHSKSALYGQGIYLSDSAQKADQYTDDRKGLNRREETLAMLICKVALGRSYVHQMDTPLHGMPCYRQGCFKPSCTDHDQCDSIIAGIKKNFIEILIMDDAQVLPMFAVIYDRKRK